MEPARTERLMRLKQSIRERLQGVCCDFVDPELDALIERIALVEIKYNMRRPSVEQFS